jgi:hypothetical protein
LSYPNALNSSAKFFKALIVKSRNVIRTNRPMKGLVAFARGFSLKATMPSLGACGAALRQSLPTSWHQLDRNEERLHPGEGSAEFS